MQKMEAGFGPEASVYQLSPNCFNRSTIPYENLFRLLGQRQSTKRDHLVWHMLLHALFAFPRFLFDFLVIVYF